MTDPVERRATHPAVVWARILVFALVALWTVGQPTLRQVVPGFQGKEYRHLRAWRMFSGKGLGYVTLRFVTVDAEGSEHPVDRFAVMGLDRSVRRVKPGSWSLVKGTRQTYERASQICRRLGPGADLRVYARIATKEGWQEFERGERNLCERSRSPRKPRGRPVAQIRSKEPTP